MEDHQRRVYRLAYDLTAARADAEDLTQDVFMQAYKTQSSLRGEQAFPWLYRMTVNMYLNGKRGLAKAHHESRSDLDAVHAGDLPSPERSAAGALLQVHIRRALDLLSSGERSAFVLKHYHDMTIHDVAATMEVAEGTVKSHLHRALTKMREALASYREDATL